MLRSTVGSILLILVSGEFVSATLPGYIKVCKRDQDTINDCVRDSIDALHPYLLKGIPELHVPGIDPFRLQEIKAVQGQLEALHVVLKNVEVYGLSRFEIKHVDVDLDGMVIKAKVYVPELDVTGQYSVDAQILALTVKGEGPFTANISHADAAAVLKYKLVKRDGQEYRMKFTSCDIKLQMKDYNVSIGGQLGDLGDITKNVISENKREVLRILMPYLENTISHTIVLETANKIGNAATYDEILPLP